MCKHSYHGQFQATAMTSVNEEPGRKEHSWLSWTGTSQLHHTWHKGSAQSVLVEWKNKWIIIHLSHYSMKGKPLDIPGRFLFFLLPFNPLSLLFFFPRHSVGFPHCLAENLPWCYSYQTFTEGLRQWRGVLSGPDPGSIFLFVSLPRAPACMVSTILLSFPTSCFFRN